MRKFNPLDHPICFSHPLRLTPAAGLAHVPFVMTLVDLLRPGVIVEVGTPDGVSYSAFCQSVTELHLNTRCYAISNGQDRSDGDSDDSKLFDPWQKDHDALYGGFSRLIQSSKEDLTSQLKEGSVDLLHLNGEWSYESGKREFEKWLPRLSQRGIVLLSGTSVHQGEQEIWRLWEELRPRYAHFEYGHDRGLGVIATGADVPEGLRQLFDAREPEISLVREFFRQQGQRLRHGADVERELPGNDHGLQTRERELELLSSALTAKTTEVEERKKTSDSIAAELQVSQQIVEITQQTLETTESRLEQTQRTVDGLAVRASQLDTILDSRAWRWVTRYGRIKNWFLRFVRPLTPLPPPQSAEDSRLRFGFDTKVPDTLVVGKGNALYVAGWCYHPKHRIRKLELVVDGKSRPMKSFGMPREDVVDGQFPDYDSSGNSYRSGFWTFLTFPEIERPTSVEIEVQATLRDGTICREYMEELTLKPAIEPTENLFLSRKGNSAEDPLVAICMTTHDPPLDLFAKQIQSIVDQTHSNWICVISDDNSRPDILEEIRTITSRDQRFHLFPTSSRLGFYHNFERSISLAPAEADFIALSDQDDHWHPDKLEVLLSQFEEGTTLVYSDMNIVDEEGRQLADTYWTTRPNNYKNFASLLMANTITGAASMFRQKLLTYVLPFPQKIGNPYHDHWIGCTALAMGEVKYVNRPLYDYVQHGSNVLGHFAPERKRFWQRRSGAPKHVWRFHDWLHARLANGQVVYFYDLMREQLMCRVLSLRCDQQLTGVQRKSLWRITHVDESFSAFLWLATRGLRRGKLARETVGAEKVFLAGVYWKLYTDLRLKFRNRVFGDTGRIAALPLTQILHKVADAAVESTRTVQRFSQVQSTQQKIAPLALKISRGGPRRINLLIPQVDLKHFFGGYITKLNLARRLAEAGFRVRIVIVDRCDYLPTVWRRQLQSYDGLEKLFDYVETAYAYDRSKGLEVSGNDVFIATTWWTAHIAHQAAHAIQKEKFLYLIQEYEPFTFPMGTFASLANQTYTFPHHAIFSTELLREYFRENRIGVFAGIGGEDGSISFQNRITSVGEVKLEDIAGRTPKKLLFYARPEAHAARNMFEIAILALARAIRLGYFTGDWQFYGVGTVGGSAKVELANGVHMTLLPRQNQEAYRQILREHDLGLSLMYTPHPSLVPIEMAAAGMLVVTNTFANKTGDELRAISSNIIAAEPTIEGIAQGLKTAVAGVADYERRAQGSRVNWATSWEQSFDETFITRIKEFINAV